MGNPVVHFEIMARDAPTLQRYYAELFGWSFQHSGGPDGYGVIARDQNMSPDGFGIGGGIGAAPDGYSGHVTFYVSVDDVEAALTKAESLGGRRMMGPEQPIEGLEIGLFLDPEGHTVGVVKPG